MVTHSLLFKLAVDLELASKEIEMFALYDDEKNNYSGKDLLRYVATAQNIIIKILTMGWKSNDN